MKGKINIKAIRIISGFESQNIHILFDKKIELKLEDISIIRESLLNIFKSYIAKDSFVACELI